MSEAPNGMCDTNTAGSTLTPCVTPFPYPILKSSRFVDAFYFAKALNSLWYGLFLGRRLYEMARTGRAFFFPARIATVMTQPLGRRETHHALLPHT